MHCPAGSQGSESAEWRRLRWRLRRGLLENDLILSAFLEHKASTLSMDEIAGLDHLLDLPDQDLLELVLGRVAPANRISDPRALPVLDALQKLRLSPGPSGASNPTYIQAANHV